MYTTISADLCLYDPRNPFHDELKYSHGDDMPKPRDNCSCDSCFYGRDELAVRLIDLLDVIYEYAGYDGGHHKQWVIDQCLRTVLGDEYRVWIANFKAGDWDTGIAP